METICLQCGDRGWTNAFVYCVQCLDFAVHRYCLDVIPETFDEFVPWVCDDCEAKVQSQSAVHEHEATPSQTRDHKVSKNIEGFSGNERKKNDLVVVQTDEHLNKDGPEQSYDSCAKDLVECGESASQCTLMQLEEKNDEHAILSPADERKRCQQSSSFQQLEEEKVQSNLMQHGKLSDGTLKEKKNKKKRKRMKKKRTITKSAMEKDQHRLGSTSSKQSYEERVKVGINECIIQAILLACDSTLNFNVKENKGSEQRDQTFISSKHFDSDTDPAMAEHPIISCNGSSKSLKKKKTIMSSKPILQEKIHRTDVARPPEENKQLNLENQCADVSNEERKLGSSNDHIENGEPEGKEERTSATRDRSNFCKDYPKDLDISPAEPVVMPIWRGIFNIWNKKYDVLDGLMAHMSSKACQKVYEAACQFQPVLQLEMHPRSDIWPKSFETSAPSGDNIALYFFPSKISEQVFDHLVEKMMHEELGLKAFVQNAELLIFTSTELPLRYWRFRSKYYLWGVFRGKQNPPSHSQSSRGEVAKIPSTNKRCDDRSPQSPLSNSASCGSSTF